MRSFLSIVLSFVLLSGTQASDGVSKNGLREAIQEFNYALTVEWDQKDKEFYGQQTEIFKQKIEVLQHAGKSRKDLILEAVAELPVSKTKQEIQERLKVLDIDLLSPYDFQVILSDIAEKSKLTGASWNGDGVITSLIPILLLAGVIVTILVISSSKKKSAAVSQDGGSTTGGSTTGGSTTGGSTTGGSTTGGSTTGGSTTGGSTTGGSTTGGSTSDYCCFHRGADGTCFHANPVCEAHSCTCYHRAPGVNGECYHCSCSFGCL